MAFIRIKKVKKNSGKVYEYAHLVEGIWRKKRIVRPNLRYQTNEMSPQTLAINQTKKNYKFRKFNNSLHKYKKFLGRVYNYRDKDKREFEDMFGISFKDFVNSSNINEIYKKLIDFELLCRNFSYKYNILYKDGFFVDLNRLIVHNGKEDVVLKISKRSGYLCSLSLEELFKIDKVGGRDEGMHLMKKLRMVGIELNPEQFYILAEKLLNVNQ
ncbi:hypothetical protein J4440_02260 [Candidatus Woesearchaeota archaeon]|nr:hypothetical protein [Candidatus Woesearchaeota archaeon]